MNTTRREIIKFSAYVFTPILLMGIVSSPFYQNNYVRPYTLFPSAGKPDQEALDLFPREGESEQEWISRVGETAPIRRRAKEIFQEQKQNK